MPPDSSPDVPVRALRWVCDPSALNFHSTAELQDIDDLLGQERASEALRFGVTVQDPGYHVFVMGRAGSGRHALTRQIIATHAPADSPPSDWCYLNRFAEARRPRIVQLTAGRGLVLKQDMAELVVDLEAALSSAFESDSYRSQTARIDSRFEEIVSRSLESLQAEAARNDVMLVQNPHGFAVAPMRKGEALSPEEFQALPEERRRELSTQIERITELLRQHVEQGPQWQRQRRQAVRELDRRVASSAVRSALEEPRAKYADHADITQYLNELEQDVVDNLPLFRRRETPPAMAMFDMESPREERQARYGVNLLVDNSATQRAPIVYESNPTYQNLLGVVENVAQFGMLSTDFTMVRAGALHRANGGYLILDADRVLTQPYAWEALKRALFAREVRIESLAQQLSLMTTVTLTPEPMPLKLRVALVGSRQLYYLLSEYDPDFAELFKIPVDVEDDVDRDPQTLNRYARFVATQARQLNTRPFERAAVARLIEESARVSGDAGKLTTHLRLLRELLRESDHCAAGVAAGLVRRQDVEQAIAQREHRVDRVKMRMREAIRRAHRRIDTQGSAVGQINGLSVIELGGFSFALPTRITATARIGEGEVVDVEREVELGGAIHSKGVLILSSFLAARYAAETPLSLKASLVFEQSYGGIEGDSASLAELCVLLSAIGRIPLKQSLAITGSVDQHGVLQVVGGINEKIEGFFDICAERGLSGDQGVIIPADNVQHLMLKQELIDAVAAGRFRILATRSVDTALECLTGLASGERDVAGQYPPNSVNGAVAQRLAQLAHQMQEFSRPAPARRRYRGAPPARTV